MDHLCYFYLVSVDDMYILICTAYIYILLCTVKANIIIKANSELRQ